LEPGALVDRLKAVPEAARVPELQSFDPRNDLHLDAAASLLLQRFHRTNEVEALSLLFELLHHRLGEIAAQLTARFALALDPDDLVARFMTRLFTDVRRPQPVVRRFLGLAHTAMRNDALNQLRSHTRSLKRMVEFQIIQPPPRDPARIASEREQADVCTRVGVFFLGVVSRCFHTLKDRDRRILLAREVEGMSYAEIAVALSLPDHQVGMILRRARTRLSKRIARALSGGTESPA